MIDLARIRQHLIDERERLEWTQAQLAERAGVRQGQISRLEDLSQPLSDLAARVLFRVIEDGFGFTLSSFFKQFEGQTKGDLPAGAIERKTARTPEGQMLDGRPAAPVSLDAHALLQAGNALVDAGGLFIAAAKGVAIKPRARADDPARRRPAGQRRRAGGNR